VLVKSSELPLKARFSGFSGILSYEEKASINPACSPDR
jgi:hypothetical protein